MSRPEDEFDADDLHYGRGQGDAPLDSEIDFDDETDDDQLPLDQEEATELGVNLDDPERLDEE